MTAEGAVTVGRTVDNAAAALTGEEEQTSQPGGKWSKPLAPASWT